MLDIFYTYLSLNKPLELDKLRMKQSIVPNVIHSLDAAHLLETLNVCFSNGINVMTIHDCFGVHPNNIETLRINLKNVFVSMYISNDWLIEFHNYNLKRISGYGEIIKSRDGN